MFLYPNFVQKFYIIIFVSLSNMTHAAPSFRFFPLWQHTQHHRERERRSGCHICKGYRNYKSDSQIKQNQNSQYENNVNHDYFTNNILSFQSFQNKSAINHVIWLILYRGDRSESHTWSMARTTISGTILIFVTVWLGVMERVVLAELLALRWDSRWPRLDQFYQFERTELLYQRWYIS